MNNSDNTSSLSQYGTQMPRKNITFQKIELCARCSYTVEGFLPELNVKVKGQTSKETYSSRTLETLYRDVQIVAAVVIQSLPRIYSYVKTKLTLH